MKKGYRPARHSVKFYEEEIKQLLKETIVPSNVPNEIVSIYFNVHYKTITLEWDEESEAIK